MSVRGNIAAVSAVLLALGLGACGTAAGTSGNGAKAADSSAGASVKPMTRKEAAEYYGKLVKPFNDAMDEFNLEYYSHDGVAASDAAAKVAKEAKAAAVKMGRAVWPKDAEKYAKATAKDFSADAVDFGKYAECATIDEMDAIQATASSESPSVGLRKVLGMEAAPDFDYFTIVDSHSDGTDVSGYAQGTFTIRNGLKSTVYHLSATIAILDKDGNSVGETYPRRSRRRRRAAPGPPPISSPRTSWRKASRSRSPGSAGSPAIRRTSSTSSPSTAPRSTCVRRRPKAPNAHTHAERRDAGVFVGRAMGLGHARRDSFETAFQSACRQGGGGLLLSVSNNMEREAHLCPNYAGSASSMCSHTIRMCRITS